MAEKVQERNGKMSKQNFINYIRKSTERINHDEKKPQICHVGNMFKKLFQDVGIKGHKNDKPESM